MIKAATLMLIAVAILAMFGKLGWLGRAVRGRKRVATCRHCGRHAIGKGPCDCGRG